MSIRSHMPLTPVSVTLYYEGGSHTFTKLRKDLSCRVAELELRYGQPDDAPYMRVAVTGGDAGLMAIGIQWDCHISSAVQVLGDEWGELNGNAQWRGLDPQRQMPWYVLFSLPGYTSALGVLTGCAAMACWRVNSAGVELMLDIRNGRRGVKLGGRRLEVATIISRRYELMPFAAARALCSELAQDAIFPSLPVYGNGDGLCSRGKNSMESVLRDSDELSALTSALTNRPYEIVDLGWQASDTVLSTAELWSAGNDQFPDMSGLAEALCNRGIRPGIALRLLKAGNDAGERGWRSRNDGEALDPSVPEVLDIVRQNVRRMADWGYQLLKHENSTLDILGADWQIFNPEKRDDAEGLGWSFADESRTSAEIIRDFYKAIRGAMGDMVIMGNDVVGHLAVGMIHSARVTKTPLGMAWPHVQHNSVNALAFRLAQNNTFFAVATGMVEVNHRQGWPVVSNLAKLQANSGSTFLTSFVPSALTTKKNRAELAACYEAASICDASVIPSDWMYNTCPDEWEVNGTEKHFGWYKADR